MIKKIFLAVLGGILLISCAFSIGNGKLVYAQGFKDQACGAAGTAQIENCDLGDNGVEAAEGGSSIARGIVTILSIVVGVAAVIMMLIGGFKYVLSNGDAKGVEAAKNTILYAIVGLVIVLFAQVLVRFVLSNAAGPEEPGRQINGPQ